MRLQGILTFSFVISNSIQVYSEKTHVHYLIIHETPVFDIIHKSEPNMSEKKKNIPPNKPTKTRNTAI